MIRASAPAKIILFGEHAVVYGFPAIAAPLLDLRAEASAVPSRAGSGLHIVAADLDQTLPVDVSSEIVDNALTLTARLVLRQLGVPPPDMEVIVSSHIPLASGLGSGAAVSAALARALAAGVGATLDAPTLSDLVYEVERMHHGTPSGIDNTVVVYEQPVYFVRGQPIERLRIGQPFQVVVGDTGQASLTKVAVGAVRSLYESDRATIQPLLAEIGALAESARDCIEHGDTGTLGPLMNRNHELLRTLTVSSPELEALVTAARSAGALGAKLSGGGRGGNMIALVTPETSASVEKALRQAGATHVISTTIR